LPAAPPPRRPDLALGPRSSVNLSKHQLQQENEGSEQEQPHADHYHQRQQREPDRDEDEESQHAAHNCKHQAEEQLYDSDADLESEGHNTDDDTDSQNHTEQCQSGDQFKHGIPPFPYRAYTEGLKKKFIGRLYPTLPSGTAARYYCGARRQASESQEVGAIYKPIPKAIVILFCALLWVVITQGDEAPGRPPADSTNLSIEGHYSMTARIRPLLFWISRKDVGGARISWTESTTGVTEIEMLIGSDPERAPRRINRWGYVAERLSDGSYELIGLMTESDEESMAEAEERISQPGASHAFKAIRGRLCEGRAESTVIHLLLTENFTFRDFAKLLELLPPAGPVTRSGNVPEGTAPGFLFALKELLRNHVASYRDTGMLDQKTCRRVFVYNATLYELTRRSSKLLPSAEINGRQHRRLIASSFQTRNLATGGTAKFGITYGTEGGMAEMPVRIVYRPRWWFEVELALEGGA
jgi:hypothetical protein